MALTAFSEDILVKFWHQQKGVFL